MPVATQTAVLPILTAQPEAPLRAERAGHTPRRRAGTLLIAGLIFVAATLLGFYRLPATIDLNSDEATYAIESVALQQTGLTRWDGTPFFVHPPLFFAIEGLYYRVRGIGGDPLLTRLVAAPYFSGEALLPANVAAGPGSLFEAIFAGRALSVVYGAAVAAVLFLLGLALAGRAAGALAAVLFLLDPYVARRDHYNMLEPLVTLFSLLMLLAYYHAVTCGEAGTRRRSLWAAGGLFGLALLSKELAVLLVPGLLVHALLFRRAYLREVALVACTGGALYGLFPLWAAAHGEFGAWWAAKTWLLRRLAGLIRDTGITRPGTSLPQTVEVNLFDYWPSFAVLLAGAALAGLFLFLYYRRGLRDPAGEFLAAFVGGSYGFFAVVGLAGGVLNEQFFYLLMPPALLALAYAILAGPRLLHSAAAAPGDPARRGRVGAAVLGLLLALAVYNAGAWTLRYGFSRDDSYVQIEGRLARTLPPGTAVAGRDPLDVYLLPHQRVYVAEFATAAGAPVDVALVRAAPVAYVILNDQLLHQHYVRPDTDFSAWAEAQGTEVARFAGRLWNTYVYRIHFP